MTTIGVVDGFDFSRRLRVGNLTSLSHFFEAGQSRCGVYILWFADHQAYFGLTKDVVHRFSSHRRSWSDIEEVQFAEVPEIDLPRMEQRIIGKLEASGKQLRNVTYASRVYGEAPFDLEVPVEAQLAWLNDDKPIADARDRRDDPDLRSKGQSKFAQLQARDDYPDIAETIRLYITNTMPSPKRSERSYWSISCLPSTNKTANEMRLAVVNVNLMETLVLIGSADGSPGFWGFINMSYDRLWNHSGILKSQLKWLQAEDVQHALISQWGYQTAGHDQTQLHLNEPYGFLLALQEGPIAWACRELNLRLMRKGRTLFGRHHNYPLADVAFG